MRIGKVPTNVWRQANLKAHTQYDAITPALDHDVADFSPFHRDQILTANATYVAGLTVRPVKIPRAKGTDLVSDQSDALLWRPVDYTQRIAEIDHVIPFTNWGCNHYRNARVLSKRENTSPVGVARPAADSFEVMCLETIDIETEDGDVIHCTANTVLTRDVLRDLLYNADIEGQHKRTGYRPTHNRYPGPTNVLASVGSMTTDDFNALYYNLAQVGRGAPKRRK